jgi:uncharacterized protein (TIGR03435 family)
MRILAKYLPAFVLCCCGLSGQAPAKPEFEVASIKPSPEPSGDGRMMRLLGGRGGPGTQEPTRYTAKYISIKSLLIAAFGVKGYQISGPDWLDSVRFDINARIPEGATKENFGPMLQHLLAERFGLAVHRETKQMPVYDLVIAKSGSKMKEHVEIESPPDNEKAPVLPSGRIKVEMGKDGLPAYPVFGGKGTHTFMGRAGTRMWASGETMSQFVRMLSDQLSKPVTDSTGLTGKYDFILSWRNENMVGPMGPPMPQSLDSTVDVEALPTLLAAVQEQLGLKLEPKKGNVDLVVIDHVEKVPTEN